MIVLVDGRTFAEQKYALEDEFEADVVASHRAFFGKDAIYVDAKKKISSKSLGGSVPDGFVFDMADPDNREFYLVEIELAAHDFYKHIFPQVTKFFAFYRSKTRQKELVEKLFGVIDSDAALKKRFKRYLGEQEIYKFLSDLVDSSQNILLIIDGEKPELPEIMDTYSDTWGKMVKLMTIKKHSSGTQSLFTVDPEFEAVDYRHVIEDPVPDDPIYSEAFHLEGVTDNVRDVYAKLKAAVLKTQPSLVFNPQKSYISIKTAKNIAFIAVRKKKLRLVVMLPEDIIRANLHHHTVKSLSASVQGFYNGPCAAVNVDSPSHLPEIICLIKMMLAEPAGNDNSV